jgi:ribosomal protein S18 acetylase RimI-like enzyme
MRGLRLREAGPQDADGIREFVCRLSPLTQHLRFFGAVSPPSSGLVRALCAAGGNSDILLVTDGAGDVVAHGMAVDDHGSHSSEIAVVVADRWQDNRIGTTLLGVLTDRAAQRGVPIMTMEVLPENRRMLGIIARRWPEAERERTSDSIIVRAAISKGAGHAPDRRAA